VSLSAKSSPGPKAANATNPIQREAKRGSNDQEAVSMSVSSDFGAMDSAVAVRMLLLMSMLTLVETCSLVFIFADFTLPTFAVAACWTATGRKALLAGQYAKKRRNITLVDCFMPGTCEYVYY